MSDQIQIEEKSETGTVKGARRRIREEAEREAFNLMRSLDAAGSWQVELHRTSPRTWGNPPEQIDGLICTFDQKFTSEEVQNLYGGGHYDLKFFTPGDDGQMKYLTTQNIKISGHPRITPNPNPAVTVPNVVKPDGPGEQVVREAMRMSQQMAQQAEERARRIEDGARDRGPDPAIQMAFDELRAARTQLSDDRREFMAALQSRDARPTDNPVTDRILTQLIDNESARITALRTQHDSEIRTMRENHREDIKRLETRHDDTIKRLDEAHKREIDAVRRAHDQQVLVTGTANASLIEGYKREISSLDRELTSIKSELGELRARKEKSPIEAMAEIAKMKEAMEVFSPSGEKEEGGSGSAIERIINSPTVATMVDAFSSRFQSGPPSPVAVGPQGQPELPINRPVQVQMPDGSVKTLVRRPNGRVVELRRKGEAPAGGEIEHEPLDPAMVAQAVAYMEGAIRNNTPPETFASSARNLVPPSVLGQLRTRGVDDFLQSVAKLAPDSPLYTINGKNWARKVAAILIGDE